MTQSEHAKARAAGMEPKTTAHAAMSAPHADRDHSERPTDLLAALQHSIDRAREDRRADRDRSEQPVAEPICARCGQPALGFATINGVRYCHADERSCYTEQCHENPTHARMKARLDAHKAARLARASEAQVEAAASRLGCEADGDLCRSLTHHPGRLGPRGCGWAVAVADAVVAAGPDADEVTLAEHGRSVREVAREVYGSEIERLKGALANARAKYADEVTRLRAEVERWESDHASLTREVLDLTFDRERLRDDLAEADRCTEAAEAERDRLAAMLNDASTTIERANANYDAAMRQAQATEAGFGSLSEKLAAAEAEVERLLDAQAIRAGTLHDANNAVRDLRAERDRLAEVVARVEALAAHLNTLAPGDRHYAARLRAALSGPTPAETPQNGPEPALSREQGTSGQSGEGEALRGAEKGEEAGR